MPFLEEMPDIVMKNILEYAGFQAIMTLRKVSHGFRNFIDDSIPEVYFDAVHITLDPAKVNVHWIINATIVMIKYQKDDNGCMVVNEEKKKLLPNMDYLTVCLGDFERTLRHQKSKIEGFHLYLDKRVDHQISQTFSKTLENIFRNHQLKVEHFDLGVVNPRDFLSILPFVSSKTLKDINLFNTQYSTKFISLEEFSKLDQWKNAEEIKIRNYWIVSRVEDFNHFSNINVYFKDLNAEDLVTFKEAAIKNTKFERFQIRYLHFNDIGRVVSFMGPSSYIPMNSTGHNKKLWFFKTPNNNEKLLEVQLFNAFNSIELKLVAETAIPTGARIYDC